MSLLPLVFSNWWEGLDQPHRLLDQDFGIGLRPEHLLTPKTMQIYASHLPQRHGAPRCHSDSYYRPWSALLRKSGGGASTVKNDKDKFEVVLDVQHFEPGEITVKLVDRAVVVEGRHEEKQDEHGWISRQFSRRYLIPEQCDIDKVTSKLSSDGVLSISAPRKEKPASEGERVISIEQTGKPAVRDTPIGVKKEAEK